MDYQFFESQARRMEDEFGRKLGPEKMTAFFDYLRNYENDFVREVMKEILANCRYMPILDDIKKACDKAMKEFAGTAKVKNNCRKCGGTYWLEFIEKSTFEKKKTLVFHNYKCDCAQARGMLIGVEHYKNHADDHILYRPDIHF